MTLEAIEAQDRPTDLAVRLMQVREWLQGRVLGQERLVDRLLIALLTGGHLIVEGAPGLAKTRAIRELAKAVDASFHRVQFTPDLLPGDITGTEIYRPQSGSFHFQEGPIFHNILLADEVNRAPAKVQSALLEAMAEHQVTVGRTSYPLPPLFLVMATQNPIEQEGTYPLPEAQLDRFLMHVKVGYPDAAVEAKILELVREEGVMSKEPMPDVRLSPQEVLTARAELSSLHLAPAVRDYIVALVTATRAPEGYDEELAGKIDYGASPRGSIALDACSRAIAWLGGSDYVTPEHVRLIASDALRHRLVLSYEAEAMGLTAQDVIERLLELVPVN